MHQEMKTALDMILDELMTVPVNFASITWSQYENSGDGQLVPGVSIQTLSAADRRTISDYFELKHMALLGEERDFVIQDGVWNDVLMKCCSLADSVDLNRDELS